jgi:ribosome-binding protein aMBF1 (putative translation factor)
VEFTVKARKQAEPNLLPTKVKTVADWIRVKRYERGMGRHHLAAKMGIATSLVEAWELGLTQPNICHLRTMVTILGRYSRLTICHPES